MKQKSPKGPKPLDTNNICKCGASGTALHKCPLAEVIPPLSVRLKPYQGAPGVEHWKSTSCNCCNKCYSKCALEV